MSKEKTLLSMRNITKDYFVGGQITSVFKGVNLEIYKNEFLVVLGESGCGKTTLFNIIGGMDSATSGEYTFEGVQMHMASEKSLTEFRKDSIGYIFQTYNLMPNLTVRENLSIITEICNNPIDVEEAIALVGLSDRADYFPSQLSGGQQQRVSIARAIVKRPKLILADEPTAALDEQTGREILTILEKIVRDRKCTLAMITHNAEIAKMGDRLIKIKDGVVADVIEKKFLKK